MPLPKRTSRYLTGTSSARGRRLVATLVTIAVGATLATGAEAASAAFPSSPTLDSFASDAALSSNWTTPALGESTMHIDPVAHELTGSADDWAAALWNNPFGDPVEVWAIIHRAGTRDANLYADVAGGASGIAHPASGYFVDFGGSTSGGSAGKVTIVRIDGPETETALTFVRAPYVDLSPGDQIGLSVNKGVIIAWYKPAAGAWSALASTVDTRYHGGNIALEEIPGPAYGFSAFGGGTSSRPVASTRTTTSITSSASRAGRGDQVTFTARVTPAPRQPRGTVSFYDDRGPAVPNCTARPIASSGRATCVTRSLLPARHLISAIYTGTPNGAFAGSADRRDAVLNVSVSRRPVLRLGNHRLLPIYLCAADSGGCTIVSSVAIALPGVKKTISLKPVSTTVAAGGTGRLTFVLKAATSAKLRLAIRRHRHAHLTVRLHLLVREGNGASGSDTFVYTIGGGKVLAQL